MPALFLSIAASTLLLVALLYFPRRRPGYSHVRHTISELGEAGSRDGRVVSLGVFLPVGLLLGAAALFTREVHPNAALLAACVGVGYAVAAFFPCDPGSPLQGSARQGVHNLGGAVEYVGGTLALWRLGETGTVGYQAAAAVVGLATVGLSLTGLFAVRGLIQRVAEAVLFTALVVALGT
jgi:hypothetical protein